MTKQVSLKGDPIQITWVDSHSPNMQAWMQADEIDHGLLEIVSVGFVLDESKKSITLASQISEADQVAGVIRIPKVCILKRKGLK